MRVFGIALAALLLLIVPARAAVDPPVLDVAAVPNLDARCHAGYARFLLVNVPRAFALSQNGRWGWFGGGGTIEEARAKALKSCADEGGTGCAIYAEDLNVVWPGRASAPLPQVPGPLLETEDCAFVPDPRFIWRGPATAAGLYVWGHGKDGVKDQRGRQPQSYVRAFNNAGFAVVRFDRPPTRDFENYAAACLRNGLTVFRGQGWRKIVVGGQSRGAWSSLQILDTPGLADAVIAVSPALLGGPSGSDNTALLYTNVHAIHAPNTRVAIAQFTGDHYVTDMDRRVGFYREQMPGRVAAFLLIDRPSEIDGHGGGNTQAFAFGYADCLFHFVMDPVPATACPPATR